MVVEVSALRRTFIYKKDGHEIKLDDIDETMPPKAVLEFYSEMYPELTTGVVEGPKTTAKGELEYSFVTKLGTKG